MNFENLEERRVLAGLPGLEPIAAVALGDTSASGNTLSPAWYAHTPAFQSSGSTPQSALAFASEGQPLQAAGEGGELALAEPVWTESFTIAAWIDGTAPAGLQGFQNRASVMDGFGNAVDVSGDGLVSAVDALQVVNWINDPTKPQVLPPSLATGQAPFVDTNGDGIVSGLDVNIIISHLNAASGSSPATASPNTSTPADGSWMFRPSAVGVQPQLAFELTAGDQTHVLSASAGELPGGESYHAAAVYDGSMLRLYVNGTQVDAQPLSGAVAVDTSLAQQAANDVRINGMQAYTTAFTALEIMALMAQPAPLAAASTASGSNAGARSTLSGFTALQSDKPLIVDGYLNESVWNTTQSLTFNNAARSDNQVRVQAAWDNSHLYFAYHVQDANLEFGSGKIYLDDGVELFVDVGNERGTSTDANDYQLIATIRGETGPKVGAVAVTRLSSGGYQMEIGIPWSQLKSSPSVGKVMGLLLANNDRDRSVSTQFDHRGLIATGSYSRPNLWDQVTLVGASNRAPEVDAGADGSTQVSGAWSLDGAVSDDGLPILSGKLSTTWSKLSGPGTVSFADASAVDTSVRFSQPGTYVLQLQASDGLLSTSDTVSVQVTSSDLEAMRASAPVVVDGNLSDAVWSQASSLLFTNAAKSDNRVMVKAAWDNTNLYFAYHVQDASLEHSSGKIYLDDGAELFVDVGHEAGTTTDGNDFHLIGSIRGEVYPQLGSVVRTQVVAGGYSMEIAIPWSELKASPTIGKVMGLLLANNDRDSGASRQFDHMGLIASGDYSRPNLWGDLSLVAINQAPVVDAGADSNMIVTTAGWLDATVNDDGLPNPGSAVSTSWTKLSGPGTVAFGNSAAVDTTVSFSQVGTYVLQLSASDGLLSSSDQVVVTVTPPPNNAPAVDAGPGGSVNIANPWSLNGTVSDDGLPLVPGTLTTTWTKLSGPGTVSFGDASAVDTSVRFSQVGTYVLQLSASDGSLTSSAQVQFSVLQVNLPPVVEAGVDGSVSVSQAWALDGTVSDDGLPNPPGALSTTWSKVSGPGTVSFANASAVDTSVRFSQLGTYVLQLQASDGLLSTSDTVSVQVTSSDLEAMRASAPVVVDGNLSDAVWSQASSLLFTNAAKSDNRVMVKAAWDNTNLYFAYHVQDASLEHSSGKIYLDDGAELFVDVGHEAGTTTDGNDFHLIGSIRGEVYPQLGSVVRTQVVTGGYSMEIAIPWSELKASPTIGKVMGLLLANNDRDSGASRQFDHMGLIASGDYSRPNLWGDLSLVAINQAPVVDAGADSNMIVTTAGWLDATVNDDGLPNPGSAVSTSWTKLSGPGTVAFGNSAAVDTTVSFSQVGTYVLQLSASDGLLSSSDQVVVTVTPPPNNAPAVDAGPGGSVNIANPWSLNGTVSDDGLPLVPGTLTTTWTKLSGPGTVSFGDASAVDTSVRFSQVGTYVLQLSASDGSLTSSAQVQFSVLQVNLPPVVEAGVDGSVSVSQAWSLDGTVSDDGLPNPPGALSTTWSKLSGPGTVSFADASAVDTNVRFSQPGTYVLQLQANDGALTATDNLTVVVTPEQQVSGFFVSPSASSTGDGSAQKPWSLAKALSHPAEIKAGDTIWLREGSYRLGTFVSVLKGLAGKPITVRSYPGERATIDLHGSEQYTRFVIKGSYVDFVNLEFTSSSPKSRVSSVAGGGTPEDRGQLKIEGDNIRVINSVIHDTIGSYWGIVARGGEFYGNIIYNEGWLGPDRPHGHGIYAQNDGTFQKRVADNIVFNQFGHGLHLWGYNYQPIHNVDVVGNISFNNGAGAGQNYKADRNFLVGGTGTERDIVINENMSYHPKTKTYEDNIGYSGSDDDLVLKDNYFAGGSLNFSSTWKTVNSSGNMAVNPVQGSKPGGITVNSNPTGTFTSVRPNEYEAGRANVAIYNWNMQSAVAVDLSKVLAVGDRYEIRHVYNIFGAPVTSGIYNGGSVMVPMRATTAPKPLGGTAGLAAPIVQSAEFGAFVVTTVSPPPGNLMTSSVSQVPETSSLPPTPEQLAVIVDYAIERWAASGVSSVELDALKQVKFQFSDLEPSTLGRASAPLITLDNNAAGHGWFVDDTPWLDEEFLDEGDLQLALEDGPAADRVDLLTVVLHEMGHVLGHGHADSPGVMGETLTPGVRRK